MNRHDGSPAGDLTALRRAAEMPQAEETHSGLADTAETLEQGVRDTAQEATDAMNDTMATVGSAVDETASVVKSALEDGAASVRRAFDLPRQVRRQGRRLLRAWRPPQPVAARSRVACASSRPTQSPATPAT